MIFSLRSTPSLPRAPVVANRELIARFEKKIQAALTRVWGEEELFGDAGGAPQPAKMAKVAQVERRLKVVK